MRPDFSFFDNVDEGGAFSSSFHESRSTFAMLFGLAFFSLFARRAWTSDPRSLFSKAANKVESSFLGTGFSSVV